MTPYYGNPSRDHLKCIRALANEGVPIIPLENCPYLDIARSHLLTEARNQLPELKAYMFIDHDMIFDAKDAIAMAMRCIDEGKAVTGATYSLRRPGSMLSCMPLNEKRITFYQPGFVLARFVATGFMVINRCVVDELDTDMPRYYCHCMKTHIRPYFERYIKQDVYYPDDVGFCYRVRDRGHDVWIDTEPRVYHRGLYDYALEDAGMVVPNSNGPLTYEFERLAAE